MENVEYVTYRGKEYIVLAEEIINDDDYIYLSNKEDEDDFIIKKVIKKNGREYFKDITDKVDMQEALTYFYNKYSDEG